MKKFLVIATTLSIVSGCTIMRLKNAASESGECQSRIANSPEYQRVGWHRAKFSTTKIESPTPEQLADKSIPSDSDVKDLAIIHNMATECRNRNIEKIISIEPALIPTLIDAYRAADDVDLELLKKKISWGEAAEKYHNIRRNGFNKAITVYKKREAEEEKESKAQYEAAANAAGTAAKTVGSVITGALGIALSALAIWSIQQRTASSLLPSYGYQGPTLLQTNCTASNSMSGNYTTVNCRSF